MQTLNVKCVKNVNVKQFFLSNAKTFQQAWTAVFVRVIHHVNVWLN